MNFIFCKLKKLKKHEFLGNQCESMTSMWLNELQFTQEDSQYALRGLEIAGAYDATWTTLAFLMFFEVFKLAKKRKK